MIEENKLSVHVGRHENTKAVVKLQKKGQGAPSREPVCCPNPLVLPCCTDWPFQLRAWVENLHVCIVSLMCLRYLEQPTSETAAGVRSGS